MFKSINLILCLLISAYTWAIDVRGVVIDENNEPIIGATVVEVGKDTNGTITDSDGRFTLNVGSSSSLRISFVGYVTQVVKVQGQRQLTVVLQEDRKALDEVVVVAFGKQKKESFVGSAGVMKSDDLAKAQVDNAAQALAGRVAGVQLTNSSSQLGSSPSLTIRGFGSISSDTEPLIVVDGVPFDGSLNLINPADIESMTVLKDASSNALYGARGANGVVMITTKKAANGDAKVTFDAKFGTNKNARVHYKTANAQQFYELFYKSLYNYYVSDEYATKNNLSSNMSASEAHQLANYNLVNTSSTGIGPGYMVYTVPTGEDFILQGGSMNPNATLGASYNYQGTNLWLQPDDWESEGLQAGFRQEYNASISGTSDKMNYYTSIGYLDQEGIQKGAMEDRLTARAKLDYQAKSWLKVGTNFNYTNWKYGQTSEGTIGTGTIWSIIQNRAPIYPVYLRGSDKEIMVDQWGELMYDFADQYNLHRGGTSSVGSNAIFSNKYRDSQTNGNSITASGYADINITKDLVFTINGSTYVYDRRYSYSTSPFVDYYTSSSNNGYLSKSSTRTRTYNTQQLLNYNKTLGLHEISALLGHEYYNYKYEYIGGSGWNFGIDNASEFGALLNLNYPSSSSSTYNNEGYFFRGMYNYDHRFYGNFSFRRDASSRFAKDNRWGNFWSVGGAWVISHENFFNADWVDMLKLKASVGSQGNDNIGNYLYANSYDIVNNNNEVAYQWRQKGSEDITWETNTNWNFGVDFDLFHGRLSGNVDAFYRKTSDMLFWLNTPPSAGYTSYCVNLGDMKNVGVELTLNGTIIQTKDFQWSANFNISSVKNKVLSLPDDVKTLTIDGHSGYVNADGSFVSMYQYFVAEGLPLYTWYLPKYAGVDPETGAALYYKDVYDEDGNVVGQETTENGSDATDYLCGDATPKVYGGIGTTLNYKGFDLSVNCNYQIGGLTYDYTYAALMATGSQATSQNWHVDMFNAWSSDNTSSNIPRLRATETYSQTTRSDRFLTKASYLSLQNINFGYTLPTKLTRKYGISTLRLFFSGENIAYVTARKGLDPRYSLKGVTNPELYSPMRTLSGGVQVVF